MSLLRTGTAVAGLFAALALVAGCGGSASDASVTTGPQAPSMSMPANPGDDCSSREADDKTYGHIKADVCPDTEPKSWEVKPTAGWVEIHNDIANGKLSGQVLNNAPGPNCLNSTAPKANCYPQAGDSLYAVCVDRQFTAVRIGTKTLLWAQSGSESHRIGVAVKTFTNTGDKPVGWVDSSKVSSSSAPDCAGQLHGSDARAQLHGYNDAENTDHLDSKY
ncbi:MAG TPA: hypothetical protein VLG40_00335 [Candidatus Saccharimonas sp.]|nr:hypothetical protein [Candidatus Saccharimonas sp.]